MRFKSILKLIGRILFIEGLLLIAPLAVSLIYKEGTYLSFLIPAVALLAVATLIGICLKKTKVSIYARDGFLIVGLSWILLSLFGCLPFILSGEIPNFFNAFFETCSGFTTTGASILEDVEVLSKGIMFWRLFTHWIGGMGVLVFVLAVMPNAEKNSAKNIYIMRAESTGPQVGKLVSKVKFSARILYLIYICLTVLEFVFLKLGGNTLYDSIVYSFSCAGTGGFATLNSSVATFSTYSQMVMAVFMFLFGINFNLFFFLLIGRFKDFFKNEELWWYVGIIVVSTGLIFLNIYNTYENTLGALKDSFFQVSSIITTTGLSTANFDTWGSLAKYCIILLMIFGACAGSTGGGLKISRFVLMVKSTRRDFKSLLHPHSVHSIHMDGKIVDETTITGVKNYFYTYIGILIIGMGLLAVEGLFIGGNDFETIVTSCIACLNNIGPGFSRVGPICNYNFYSGFGKMVLSFLMLVGRLEIYPMILLFSPSTYKK